MHTPRILLPAALAVGGTLACARAPESPAIPPAPVLSYWPEPAFDPAWQCHGEYSMEDLQRFLPHARLALWLPGTVQVALDERRHCIDVGVEDVNSGAQAELVIRGVAVPRRAVLLEVTGPPPVPHAQDSR